MALQDKIDYSISLLRRAEPMALRMSEKGYFLAFSGGKDSQCLYHIAKEAGVKFEAHYQLTTLDPPELVYFIREHYPDVIIDRPKLTFLQLCEKKGMLPTRVARFCCAELKECAGAGMATLIGIRKAESRNRAKRNEVEVSGRKFSGSLDQFNRENEIEDQCMARYGKKDKLIIAPIIEWSDKDVWDFIHDRKLSYCKLYDEGWKRIGCLFCPMARKSEMEMYKERYPKYRAAIIRVIAKIRAKGKGYANDYPELTAEQVFDWWTGKSGIKEYYAKHFLQKKLEL